jgi:DNA-binding MarR family transcriptional regulator
MILKTINDSVETLNQSKLYKIISGDRSSFDKALKSLIEMKYISTEDLGKGRAINYSITETGQKHIEEWNDQ